MHNVVSIVVYKNIELAMHLLADLEKFDFINQIQIRVVKAEANNKLIYSNIHLTNTTNNLGYAKAHNENFHDACLDYPALDFNFTILNCDINIKKGFKEFVTAASVGMLVAPVIKLNEFQYGYGRKFDDILGKNKWNFSAGSQVDWVSGCAFCVSALDFSEVKFDENFFMYAEDLNFCLSIRKRVKFEICEGAVIEHLALNSRSESLKKGIYRSFLSYRNNIRIAERHSRCKILYNIWNIIRFSKNIIILLIRYPKILSTLYAINAKKLNNKDLVEFVHDEKI